ncbi:uncharacterized protein LOC129909734 [Episyrphus balteatus]|uniref:uncharacterized protein LOC129909734 n=1 Tax=Episyrphus balteatus TaxID=286459 RepID=UPI002484DF13|nr:uncharacterized protein LOC129909734 [Episyrphus balteatus]
MQTENGGGISAPEHLNKSYFENALQNGLHEQSIQVKNIKFTSGSGDGDNYCSQIYRALIVYSKADQENPDDEISVIVKVMPSNEGLNFLDKMNVFNKEKWLIMDILPQFEILLDDVQFAPRCYYSTYSPLETLVLEDMNRFGFHMVNREIGLDERQAKLTLKKLGQFHASSMVYAKKRPSMMQHYNKGLLDPEAIKPPTSLYKMLYKHLAYEIKISSKWEGFEKITEKMKEFYNEFDSRLFACQKPLKNEIKVLNHGDFWVNNLLFKYDDRNNPVDLVFLDFQLSIYGSPGIDLNYFIFASVQMEVLKKWKTLLEVYYVSLRDTLKELGYQKIPTYANIEKEFKQKSAYGFFTLIGPLPVMTMQKEASEGNNFETLAESDDKTEIIFSSEKLIDRLKYSLLELDKMGALDIKTIITEMTVEFSNSVNAPESLDAKFFQEVLENGLLEAYVKVKKVSFEMGSSGGDNYCSKIYRVRLTFQRANEPLESISVIVKSIPLTDASQFLEHLRVFLKEKIFYNNMLPRMEVLMDKVKFGPRIYHSLSEPISTLVFEDLSSLGYVMADREEGLDMGHCEMVLRKLGQFHGVSMVLQKKDPASMNSFRFGMVAEEAVNASDVYKTFFGNNIDGLIRNMSKWKGYESITEKVKKYAANLKENLIKTQKPIPGELKVLNHGDLWVNNFLFKYKNDNRKQPEDVVFVDFQLSLYGSPGIDLNYFFYTSLQLDVLKEKRNDLLKTYYRSLCETLKAQNYKEIPSFDNILTEVRRRESYGFFASFGIFPAVAMDKEQSGDNSIDNFMDEDFAKKKIEIMFASKRIEETMKYTMKRFDEMGVLD